MIENKKYYLVNTSKFLKFLKLGKPSNINKKDIIIEVESDFKDKVTIAKILLEVIIEGFSPEDPNTSSKKFIINFLNKKGNSYLDIGDKGDLFARSYVKKFSFKKDFKKFKDTLLEENDHKDFKFTFNDYNEFLFENKNKLMKNFERKFYLIKNTHKISIKYPTILMSSIRMDFKMRDLISEILEYQNELFKELNEKEVKNLKVEGKFK